MKSKVPIKNLIIVSLVALPVVLSMLAYRRGQSKKVEYPVVSPFRLRVVDEGTSLPVFGAIVMPLCMGGTGYETNAWCTDKNGYAQIVTFNTMAAFTVTKDGYEKVSLGFIRTNGLFTNAVVSLKRKEK
jgi:hypothetical protein